MASGFVIRSSAKQREASRYVTPTAIDDREITSMTLTMGRNDMDKASRRRAVFMIIIALLYGLIFSELLI